MDIDILPEVSVITQFPHWPLSYWLAAALACCLCSIATYCILFMICKRRGSDLKHVTSGSTRKTSQTSIIIPCPDGCKNIVAVECGDCHEQITGCSECYKVWSPCSCGEQENGTKSVEQTNEEHKQSVEQTADRIQKQKQQQIEEQNVESQHKQNENEEQNMAQSEMQSSVQINVPAIPEADLPPADDDQIRNNHFEQQINEPKSTVEYQRLNKMYRHCCEERKERDEQIKNLSADLETSLKIVGNLTEKLNMNTELRNRCREEQNEESQHEQNENENEEQDVRPADDGQRHEPQSTVEYETGSKTYAQCCENREDQTEQIKHLTADLQTSLKIVGHLNENLHQRSEFQKRCENEITDIKHQIKNESESFRKAQKQNQQILQESQQNKQNEEISKSLSKMNEMIQELENRQKSMQKSIIKTNGNLLEVGQDSPLLQICQEVADGKLLCQSYAPEEVLRTIDKRRRMRSMYHDPEPRQIDVQMTGYRNRQNESAYDSNSLMDIPEIHDLSKTDMMGELDTVSMEQEIQRRKDCRKYSMIQRGRAMNVPEIHDLSEADVMRELSTVSMEHEVQRRKDYRKYRSSQSMTHKVSSRQPVECHVRESPGPRLVIVQRKQRNRSYKH